MKTREVSLQSAIESIKNSDYHGTAIKIELEAQLDRENDHDCYDCQGRGERRHCDVGCTGCDHTGWQSCSVCGGNGTVGSRYYSEDKCEQFILGHVSKEARDALVFKEFYEDGSVDSEFTFTLMLDDTHYAVEFVKAFKLLGKETGSLDTRGAGMHMAILNSSNGNYPGGNEVSRTRFHNMKRSLTHLLPALFFLGAADYRNRPLTYRAPKIDYSDKYSAISGRGGVGLEFRVFETCYDHPERVLDNVCVIAKCLEFYKDQPVTLPWFGKVGVLSISHREPYLNSFYFTYRHLDALDFGLQYLIPDHKTIQEVKRERNFKVTKDSLKKRQQKLTYQWRSEFYEQKVALKEQLKGIDQSLEEVRANAVRQYRLETRPYGINYPSLEAFIERCVTDYQNRFPKRVTTYIKNKRLGLEQPDDAYKVSI